MSIIKATVGTMVIVIGLILSYFLFSPIYYTTLHVLNTTVVEHSSSGSNARNFASTSYGIFYYGLSSLIVLGVLAAIYWLYMFVRRRYYNTDVGFG